MKVLELELSRVEAFYLLSVVYCAICAAVLAYVVRLSQVMPSLPDELVEPILDQLARHESLVNPLAAYPLPSLRGRKRYWGFILLITIFWLGVTSLYALIFENHLPLIGIGAGGFLLTLALLLGTLSDLWQPARITLPG